MSLLPGKILPQTIPLGKVNDDQTVTIDTDWWLLLYNLCAQTLGTSAAGLPADALMDLESADTDAIDSDAIALRSPLAVLAALLPTEGDPSPSLSDVRNALLLAQEIPLSDTTDLRNALILALDGLLPDPQPVAQPVQTITVGASPFTYIAPFNGQVSVTGGTVSLIQIIRQGTTVATGLTTGLIPVSRGDQVKVTYTVVPTVVFLPS
jgi:hypothetical protein